jgi:hypothetical protein
MAVSRSSAFGTVYWQKTTGQSRRRLAARVRYDYLLALFLLLATLLVLRSSWDAAQDSLASAMLVLNNGLACLGRPSWAC